MSYFMNLTPDEVTRMHPCTKAKCVITTSDSKMETLSDIADGVQPVGKLSLIEPSSPSSSSSNQHNNNDELDAINHIVSKEPSSMTEKNGFNNYDNKVTKNDTKNDDDCFVKCLYVTQQCCECVIL
ncbi:hypothetical protein HCN44_001162 [Aphidius gifuensis]|uniref:Uncharacterized protein n=1 Tax=Aphidius gifuensis TaxID=684658 RepID=A0A835CLB3_APHGI|nr:uncharacterized protein LOC122856888 isoform X2 [Aphidius gifuensis]KAF7988589.1 hypothetical protein HCN44_001162 [Aphidius gifuensis]